jgi:hypothetical protein
MEAKRADVLRSLENARIGMTSRPLLEQSDCAVFSEGELVTFDGEILVRQPSPFGQEFTGAIPGEDLIRLLQRFPDESLQFISRENELLIRGKRRKAGVKMMSEILLPFTEVPSPGKMNPTPARLQEAMVQAAEVCGKDESLPLTTHIHITPDHVEATDSFCFFRATVLTSFASPLLLHAPAAFQAAKKTWKEVGVKSNWLHIKTTDGALISIAGMAGEYYQDDMLKSLLAMTGTEINFPRNLAEILDRAQVMDTPDASIGLWDSRVTLTLEDGVLTVSSRKEGGWFKETKRVHYDGPSITFTIHPSLLRRLLQKTHKVTLNQKQMMVRQEDVALTVSLEPPTAAESEKGKAGEEGTDE